MAKDVRERNRRLVKMYRQGMAQSEIAERTGVHIRMVNLAIARAQSEPQLPVTPWPYATGYRWIGD